MLDCATSLELLIVVAALGVKAEDGECHNAVRGADTTVVADDRAEIVSVCQHTIKGVNAPGEVVQSGSNDGEVDKKQSVDRASCE